MRDFQCILLLGLFYKWHNYYCPISWMGKLRLETLKWYDKGYTFSVTVKTRDQILLSLAECMLLGQTVCATGSLFWPTVNKTRKKLNKDAFNDQAIIRKRTVVNSLTQQKRLLWLTQYEKNLRPSIVRITRIKIIRGIRIIRRQGV